MFISAMNNSKKEAEKIVFLYLLVAIFCACFGAVYEWFSHGVFSYYMLYAFMVPLIGGAAYFYCFLYFRSGIPGRMACRFQHFGIAALTVGCMINGVLEIYGTTNRLVSVYFIVGGGFLLVGNLMNLL